MHAANLYTKFEVSMDITGGVKFLNVSRVPDPTHAHLGIFSHHNAISIADEHEAVLET